jgi:capsular exopolysaccharide synthesis family protein
VIKNEVLKDLPEGAEKATDPEEWFKTHQAIFEKAFAENEKKLKAELDEIQAEREDLERFSLKGSRITREIEAEQKKLDAYKSESEKLRFEIENTPTMIQESRRAEPPHARSLKKKTMLTAVAGFGVFGFFVAGIVFLELRTQRIATVNQVTEQLNLRVMGTVPLLPHSVVTGTSVKKKAKNALWYSALTEAIDSTRTLLIRGSQIEHLKTVMIASAMGGEGKTTMASHLATSLARGGRKILLIDCDLRRPCMHRAFDLPLGQGVCEILRGQADVADCIQELESPVGLSVLPAGKIDQQVLKLLALDSFQEMLEPLKKQYDFIIIDSSPLLPVADGLLIAQHVDGVILSIRRDVSRIGKVVMACQKMSMLGVPLLGAVTIGLQEESGYQAKYGYNYYGYGHRQHYYTQPPI